jgi:hypothetical protein
VTRNILLAVVLLIGALIVLDRSHERHTPPAAVITVPVAAEPPAQSAPRRQTLGPIISGESTDEGATPAIDQMARLAIRRRLARDAGRTYLDSMLAHSDSVLTRWPDGAIAAISVAFVQDTAVAGWNSAALDDARAGMRAWDNNDARIALREVAAPDSAGIVVMWATTLPDSAEVGHTDLHYGPDGVVSGATITLALRQNSDSALLPPAVRRMAAAHEFGHALGLPHSGDRGDLMYGFATASSPSRRDQATLLLLYSVSPGPLRIPQ